MLQREDKIDGCVEVKAMVEAAVEDDEGDNGGGEEPARVANMSCSVGPRSPTRPSFGTYGAPSNPCQNRREVLANYAEYLEGL